MATSPEALCILDWSDPDTERLFEKATNSPAEITQEEKHKIAEWIPSRPEMEARTQKHLNQSLDSLLEAAATDKESLTYPQYMMIAQGFHLLGVLDNMGRDLAKQRRSYEQRALQSKWKQARAAVLSDTELGAVLSTSDPLLRIRLEHEYYEPRDRAVRDAKGRPAPWIQRILDREGEKGWGYVIYGLSLDGSPEWERFRGRFDEIVSEVPFPALGTEEIRHTKVADFSRFDGQTDDFGGVRTNFRALREQGCLKPGVLSNVVLYITFECRSSCDDAMYSWLWALDPDWSIDGADEDGYDGKVPVNWMVCYDKFYNFMSMGTFSLKDIWREFNHLRQRDPIPGWGRTDLDKPQWPER
ncbi:hypothetical protein BJX99DRAFT_235246 [Aspergillus californicus]